MLTRYWAQFELLVRKIAQINIVLVGIALCSLATGIAVNVFWFKNEITQIIGFRRLRLLTYESSYYGAILVPFFFYYFQHFFFKTLNKERVFLFSTIIISICLSLSYGTIGGIAASVIIVALINLVVRRRAKFNKRVVITTIIVGSAIVIISIFALSDSGFVARIFNILEGKDSSVNGRTFDSYTIALNVLTKENAMLFGIGPGQFKVLGVNEVNRFYEYFLNDNFEASKTVRLPCANAETLVTYGVVGLVIRLLLEIYLFIKTDVASSSYRLHLFVFIFLTQFAGSNLTNLPEYFIWAICFTPKSFYDNFFIGNTPATRKISRS
ncbi:O-antigen ligase [Dyadobacter sp. 50-39]|uniref:O-antigen ligase family protein n=1 Tax=Dyadobacter sp. 50-39 TaxID=1895756 RepID=UPI0025C4B271|nr:O-antigen ligase family protein [Dyadobacter sp. 50-39]